MICWGFIVFMYCNPPKQVPLDSYCQTYIKIVQEKGDGSINATLGVKKRILANENIYRKLCK